MKKTIYLFMILCALFSCTKENPQNPEKTDDTPQKAELSLEIPSNLVASETVTITQMSLLGTMVEFSE